jgi:hypothetical protein
MPSGEGLPQIMPAEIKYPGTLQCIAPGLGIDLHDGLALVGAHMRRVIALALLQHIERRLVERDRMWPAILVIGA